MRRALLIVGAVMVTFLACRTTQPPGTENAQPIGSAGEAAQPDQLMPAVPAGPSSPMVNEDGGTPP